MLHALLLVDLKKQILAPDTNIACSSNYQNTHLAYYFSALLESVIYFVFTRKTTLT